MRTISACLALISTRALSHQGHGPTLPHLHEGEVWALASLAAGLAVACWWLLRGWRR